MHKNLESGDENRQHDDGTRYFEYKNLRSIRYYSCEPRATIEISDNNATTTTTKYFLCQAPHYAFGHWVCEFFCPCIPLIKHFLMSDKDVLYILFSKTYRFMVNMLLWIGVPKNQIILASDYDNGHIRADGEMGISFINTSNTVVLPPLLSLNDRSRGYNIWVKHFLNLQKIVSPSSNKIPYTFLVRGNKDNYTSRNRQEHHDTVEDWVIEHDGVVMDPYTINNFGVQEWVIRNSQVIITNSGSSYCVNGLCAHNSTIFVIDEINLNNQMIDYPGVGAIDTFIRKNNQVQVFQDFNTMLLHLNDLQRSNVI
jgi:hypothetical protein